MASYIKNSNGTYSVNYEDERFQEVENEKNQQLTETNNRYDQMINNSDQFYQSQIDAAKDYADKQSQIQQEQTDFAIDKINQQKDQASKDYTREQKASYADYMKQINPYSVNAETMAANGLQNTGYSESSRVSMWNTYQNRYATARESYNNAILNYDNGIKEAQLANSSALAEIAYNALQQQLELSLQGFQYKNTLLQTKEQQINQINETYYNRYQNVLSQINTEIQYQMETDKILEDSKRWLKEFNATQRQREIENEQWQKEYELKEKEAERNYQLALAQERRAAAAAKSSSGSYIVSNNSSGLSSRAQELYDKFYSLRNRNGGSFVSNIKQVAGKLLANPISIANAIDDAYQNGEITKNDVIILSNKLGI